MWRYQPSELHDLKRTVLIFSCIVHALVLGWLLFFYNSDDTYHLFVGKDAPNLKQAAVVVIPFGKGFSYQAGTGSGHGGAKHGLRHQTTLITKKHSSLPKSATTIGESTKKTKSHARKNLLKKSLKGKKRQKRATKINRKLPAKPNKNKKKIQEKPTNDESELLKNAELEKIKETAAKKKNIQEMPVESVNNAEQAVPETSSDLRRQIDLSSQAYGDGQGPIVFVGQQEMALLQMQQEVQQEIERCWKPPLGLSKDLLCEVHIVIDKEGVVQEAKVHKASGVLVYDINARSTVLAMNFPQCVWGKELMLHFKQ